MQAEAQDRPGLFGGQFDCGDVLGCVAPPKSGTCTGRPVLRPRTVNTANVPILTPALMSDRITALLDRTNRPTRYGFGIG